MRFYSKGSILMTVNHAVNLFCRTGHKLNNFIVKQLNASSLVTIIEYCNNDSVLVLTYAGIGELGEDKIECKYVVRNTTG